MEGLLSKCTKWSCPLFGGRIPARHSRRLADPLLPIRVGLTQKSEGMEPLESRLQFTLGQRRLTLEAEHEPISAIPGSY